MEGPFPAPASYEGRENIGYESKTDISSRNSLDYILEELEDNLRDLNNGLKEETILSNLMSNGDEIELHRSKTENSFPGITTRLDRAARAIKIGGGTGIPEYILEFTSGDGNTYSKGYDGDVENFEEVIELAEGITEYQINAKEKLEPLGKI